MGVKVQMLRWKIVCVDCGKEFGLNIQTAQRHERRKGHRVTYSAYLWESRE